MTRHIIYFHKQFLEVVASIAMELVVLHRNHRTGSYCTYLICDTQYFLKH